MELYSEKNQRDKTFEQYQQLTFLQPIAGVSEHPVKTFQSQENEQDLKEIEAVWLKKYLDLSGRLKKNIDPSGCSTKMLRECCQAIKDLTTSKYSIKWANWGTILNGNCSTQKISECPKIGKECSLSDILEEEVPEKYFLSEKATQRLLNS